MVNGQRAPLSREATRRSLADPHPKTQRDVFERITIDAALRAGFSSEAETVIKSRSNKRGALDRFAEQRLEICGRMQKAEQVMEDENLRAANSY